MTSVADPFMDLENVLQNLDINQVLELSLSTCQRFLEILGRLKISFVDRFYEPVLQI